MTTIAMTADDWGIGAPPVEKRWDPAEPAWLAQTPEYRISVYSRLMEFASIFHQSLSISYFFAVLSGIGAIGSLISLYTSSSSGFSLFIAVYCIVSGGFFGASAYGLNHYKQWGFVLLFFGLAPGFLILNPIAIIVAIVLSTRSKRAKELEIDFKEQGLAVTGADFEIVMQNIVSPVGKIFRLPVIEHIEPGSRLYALEAYVLKQVKKRTGLTADVSTIQTPEFRASVRHIYRLSIHVGYLVCLAIAASITLIYATNPLFGGANIEEDLLRVFFVFGIVFFLPASPLAVTRDNLRFQYPLITATGVLLLIVLLLSLGLFLDAGSGTGLIFTIIELFLLIPLHFARKTQRRAKRAFDAHNVPYEKDILNELKTMHCILSSYHKRFVSSEESGWDDDESNDMMTIVSDETPEPKGGDWEFNTTPRSKSQRSTEERPVL